MKLASSVILNTIDTSGDTFWKEEITFKKCWFFWLKCVFHIVQLTSIRSRIFFCLLWARSIDSVIRMNGITSRFFFGDKFGKIFL